MLILVCIRICDNRVTNSACLKALPVICVPVQFQFGTVLQVMSTREMCVCVCVGDTFSPMSRVQPPAIIFLADCCFHFYDQHKRKQKMFYREMSLWATRTGFPVSGDQDWSMSRPDTPKGYMNCGCVLGLILHFKRAAVGVNIIR